MIVKNIELEAFFHDIIKINCFYKYKAVNEIAKNNNPK